MLDGRVLALNVINVNIPVPVSAFLLNVNACMNERKKISDQPSGGR